MRRQHAPKARAGSAAVQVLNGVAALPVRVVHDEETDEPFLEMLLIPGTHASFVHAHMVPGSPAGRSEDLI